MIIHLQHSLFQHNITSHNNNLLSVGQESCRASTDKRKSQQSLNCPNPSRSVLFASLYHQPSLKCHTYSHSFSFSSSFHQQPHPLPSTIVPMPSQAVLIAVQIQPVPASTPLQLTAPSPTPITSTQKHLDKAA